MVTDSKIFRFWLLCLSLKHRNVKVLSHHIELTGLPFYLVPASNFMSVATQINSPEASRYLWLAQARCCYHVTIIRASTSSTARSCVVDVL